MATNAPTVYVSAPPGTGKSRNAEELCVMFGCTSIVDEWDGLSPVPSGALVLTNCVWPVLEDRGS